MVISEKMNAAINKQIQEESFSAWLYLSMSNWFEARNLKGMAHWMQAQAFEELFHSVKFQNFINERGGTVVLTDIAKPQTEWQSPLEAFEAAYAHEQHITSCIHGLVDLAMDERDHASASLLRWYVDEQVEEEANADEIVQQLKMIGSKEGLYLLDKELATRPLIWPGAAAAQA